MERPQLSFEGTSDAVSGGTTIVTLNLGKVHKGYLLNFEVDNSAGTQTITDCILQLQDHANGEWYNYKGSTDWDSTTDTNILFNTTLGVQEVTAGNKAHAHVRINAAWGARFVLKAASSSPVTVRGTGRAA